MKKNPLIYFVPSFFTVLSLSTLSYSQSIETKGLIGGDVRYFTEQSETQLSLALEYEWYVQSEKSNNDFNLKLFGRLDDTDDERTHIDIREAHWLHFQDTWELRLGISKVFWGVTESAHLVDIINQTDSVESVDGEEKLGQPMVQWSSIQEWGVFDIFILPYFRERQFSSIDAPLSFGITVDSEKSIFESGAEERHIDFALRYSHTAGVWDYALSHFSGTAREPVLIPNTETGELTFTPFYPIIDQTGVELQATLDAWLLKFEGIYQANNIDDFSGVVTGFEWTQYGILDSVADLGYLLEYHYDSRNKEAPIPLQNDIFLGSRLSFNDVQDSAILFGIIQDIDHEGSRLGFVEASRRFGDRWVLTLDARFNTSGDVNDPVFLFEDSDHMTLDATYYF